MLDGTTSSRAINIAGLIERCVITAAPYLSLYKLGYTFYKVFSVPFSVPPLSYDVGALPTHPIYGEGDKPREDQQRN